MYNSFDVFDTVIGRICYKGKNIFSILENKHNLDNFKNLRTDYESQTHDFDKTYDLLENYYKIDLSNIKQDEIDIEYEMSFPIDKYLKLVKPNDIFISDMYLSDKTIKNMIQKHGNFNNDVFVSYDGKSSEKLWRDSNFIKKINTHIGDNYDSDYVKPLKNGVSNAKHITDTQLNSFEMKLSNINSEISYCLRALRLTFHSNNLFWNIFVQFALPFAILVCFKIKHIVENNNIDNIVFLSRDGYWFKIIYDILFSRDFKNTHYIYFSRQLAKKNSNVFKKEIDNIKGKKFVFDLQGSGKTFTSLNIENVMYFVCILSQNSSYEHYFFKNEPNLKFIRTVIEDMFLPPHGSVNNFDNDLNQYILDNPEHNIELFYPYMDGVKVFENYISIMHKYNLIKHNLNKIINNIDDCFVELFGDQKKLMYITNIIKTHISHVNDHSQYNNTGTPLTYFSQIEQDKYFVEQISKFQINKTFLEIGGYDGITGSNTYFLEKKLNWDGLVVECNPDMFKLCQKNRRCKLSHKAIYEKDNEKVKFTIPTGSEIEGGKQQLAGITDSLRKESLEAFSNSYKTNREIEVETITINTLLEKHKLYNINYCSLDVEGYELSILKTWDFDKYKVKFITVEHANIQETKNEIYNFLTEKGFKLHRNNKWDDEYINPNY